MIFNWQRVFLLLSLLFFFCIRRRKLCFITTPKVISYSKNPSQGKENKAQLCTSLLTPADTDTSLTLGWNHTWSSLHEHTFLRMLGLISRLVSRWSYTTVLKIVIKSLQPDHGTAIFSLILLRQQHQHGLSCGNVTAVEPPCVPPLPLVALNQQQCLWLDSQSDRGSGTGWGRARHTEKGCTCVCASVCVWRAQQKRHRLTHQDCWVPGLRHLLPSTLNTMDVYDNPLGIFTVIQWVS